MLLTIFAFGENQHINFLAITTCIVAITMFKVTGGIYDKSWIDTLEMSFLVNLGVLAAATSYSLNFSINDHRAIATYISISIALLTFIGIIYSCACLLATQEAASVEGQHGSFNQ